MEEQNCDEIKQNKYLSEMIPTDYVPIMEKIEFVQIEKDTWVDIIYENKEP